MTLDRLIDLLAETAARKLSQEREKKDAASDALGIFYAIGSRISRGIRKGRKGFPYTGWVSHYTHFEGSPT